jgi:PAS domain S-box-containing protein
MRARLWLAYLLVGVGMLMTYLFVPGARIGPLFNAIGLSGAAAIVIAVRIHRPEQRLAWYLVAIGQLLFVGGDVITYNYERFFGTRPPFPSIGDALYLSVYPFLVAGILLLIRRRSPGGDRTSLIDSLIIAVGVGAMSWIFLIAPYVRDASLSLSEKSVAMGYPIMDIIMFTAFVRLAVGGGRRQAAFYLITMSVLTLFVTDSIYTWIVLHGEYNNTTGYLELGWGMFYVLWGAGALHQSVRSLDERAVERVSPQPRRRLLLLAAASLLSPTVLLIQALRHALKFDEVGILASCTIALFVLVLVRLKGVMVDISEYRRTERQLLEAENRYRTLVEGLPAVVYIADFGEEGPWRYISPQIESIFGFSRDEWMSGAKVWREHIMPEDRQRAMDAELQLLHGSGRMQCEYRIIGKDGRVIWIREEAEPLPDEQGRPAHLQGVMYDISEQKAAEEQLRRALETEKEASSRLRTLHEMQNSFLQAVSHDLRTPLTSILGTALTLENDDGQLDPEDSKDLLHRLAANARKLHRLLTNLLDLDRMSRGIIEPNRDLIDVTRIAVRVIEETSADDHPIQLVTSAPLFGYVDAAHVERIMENLVTNAVRYTPAGTPIWVSIDEDADDVLITVEDAGPGVPPELRTEIFEPFRQGSETLPHAPGVGIGLSLVTRFAQLHGGRAWCEERQGGGARFRVLLRSIPPSAQTEPAAPPADAPSAPKGTPVVAATARKRGPRSLARTPSRRRADDR